MKKLILFASILFNGALFAQTPEAIENDLLNPFKKIWTSSEGSIDYNTQFANKLKKYAVQNPQTINQSLVN